MTKRRYLTIYSDDGLQAVRVPIRNGNADPSAVVAAMRKVKTPEWKVQAVIQAWRDDGHQIPEFPPPDET